jgi:anti-anti-sigma factor
MTIDQQFIGKYLLMALNGRLDATWADYVKDTCLGQIRSGHHHLIVDAENLSFLSSAGIRTLMIVAKEIQIVDGSFNVLKATPFVAKTITMTGLGQWLTSEMPAELKEEQSTEHQASLVNSDQYLLHSGPGMQMEIPARWRPWQQITPADLLVRRFPANAIALGIGSAAETSEDALKTLGDFMAVAGHVVYQPPEKHQRPDYLIQKNDYIPEMQVVQLLDVRGDLTHQFRFAPDHAQASFGIAALALRALRMTEGRAAIVVMLAEVHGLVGASVSRSPGLAVNEEIAAFPEVREWISFTGEPIYQGHQCLLCGVVSDRPESEELLLKPLPAQPGLYGHFHAAVFPYQPLPNGKIDLTTSVQNFFNGPPPLAMMHLIDDQRPVQGTGESSFIRGACWCAPIQSSEELS